ncbi:unnamed protein product [Closterium sp. NIES-64]|nr:unnamed protein product [Closterium sp. NIES-64]
MENTPLSCAHMVHYVDVHLSWSHSICACCLPCILRPAPPTAFQISSLSSLRKHLQQPYVPTRPPFRFSNNPPRSITAYSATVPLPALALRPPGLAATSAAAAAAAAAANAAAEEHATAPLGPAGWGRLLGVATAKGGGSEGQAAPGDWLCCPPAAAAAGGRDAHGQVRGGGLRGAEGKRREELRKGLRGVEWEKYVKRMGGISTQRGVAGEQYRCCCSQCGEGRATSAVGGPLGNTGSNSSGMVIFGVDPAQFALKCGTLFCQPLFAHAAALIFFDRAGTRHKERVEDAAVEEAVHRLSRGERSTEGSDLQDRGQCLLLLLLLGPQVRRPRNPILQVALVPAGVGEQ